MEKTTGLTLVKKVTNDNAPSVSAEEMAKEVEESRVDKEAIKDGINKAAAEEYMRDGRDHRD